MKSDWSNKVKVRAIIELAGRPKEHVENSMKLLIDKLKTQEDLKVEEAEIFDAKKLVEEGSMYTIFAEIVLDAQDLIALSRFCFDYTPSSIEILEPEQLKVDAAIANNFLNDLLGRLHETDMVLKNVRAEHKALNVNATALLRNFIMMCLRDGEKPLKEIAELVGISEEQIKPFISAMIESNIISEIGDKYYLVR